MKKGFVNSRYSNLIFQNENTLQDLAPIKRRLPDVIGPIPQSFLIRYLKVIIVWLYLTFKLKSRYPILAFRLMDGVYE